MPQLEKDIIILNAQGLHARPAAVFVQIAQKYNSEITVSKDGEKVNGKSIMGILMLGAQKGSTIKLIVEGDDADKALQDLEEFLKKDE
jgi:phosphocarrier protein